MACDDTEIPPRPYGCAQVLAGTCVPAADVTAVEDETEIGYPVYWVGREINGLEFSTLSSTGESAAQGRGVTFDYGVCKIAFGDEGCAIPLTITTSPYCEVPFDYGGAGWRESEFREAKRYDFSPDLTVLRTGLEAVSIQADDPTNVDLAALALRRLTNAGVTPDDGLLAPPEEVDCLGVSTED